MRRPSGPKPGPLAAGIELGAGTVRVVAGRREEGRLRIIGSAASAIAPGTIRAGLVADRAAVQAAFGRALRDAERGERAHRLVVAIDGDDVRTFHLVSSFEREAPNRPISDGEVIRATREANGDLAERAAAAAAEDAGLRAVPTARLREDLATYVLDGRALPSVSGYQGRHLDVRADVAIAPLVVSGAARAAVASAGRDTTLASGIHALARLLVAADMGDAVLVRVTGELSSVAVLRAGAAAVTRSFSLGRDDLIGRRRDADADVWASCVLEAIGEGEIPARWRVAGIGEQLAALPRALAREAGGRRGSPVEVAPLRLVDAARVLADATLVPDEMVAAAAAALAAEVI